jgi:hypothetical protein
MGHPYRFDDGRAWVGESWRHSDVCSDELGLLKLIMEVWE